MNEVGHFLTLLTLLNILFTIGQLGLNKYLLIIYTKYNSISDKTKRNLFFSYLLVNVIISAVYILIIYFSNPNDIKIALLIIPLGIATNLIIIYTTMIQVFSKYITIGFSNVLVPLMKVMSLILVSLFWEKKIIDVSLNIFFLSMILILYVIKKILDIEKTFFEKSKGSISLNDVSISEFIKILIPYTILNFTFLIYTQSTTFILGISSHKADAAIFANAYFILNAIFIFPTLLFQKVYAHKFLDYIYTDNVYNLKKDVKKLDFYILFISIFIMILLYIFATDIIYILYGDKYIESINIFKWLLIIIPFRLILISRGTIMSSDYMIKIRVKLEIFFALSSIIINFIITTHFGLHGSVFIVILNEILLSSCFVYFVRTFFKKESKRRH
ncbi:hypothetical protein [Macrococcoides caseolyticum]|uniref:hypothetical protein n=1 Tax=Macrococcoides caseolyticum TaxID=69966 RepID=UPI0012FEB3E8|nr:hypothetical protein [Macrococcus caseolyticus]